ncbi:helix-hairpin-helix domain-containing protein [Bacteroides congonensis]|uniref:helix-hairpin-helix domain-containing protein n=1 Tax=Bacteroides congonensis TaxID=1871006 RepID=UPI00189B4075|nr:DNA polymerase III subunit alpha [Bacteroides congonensis]
MVVKSVEFKQTQISVHALDCLTGNGFRQGDGGSLPDIDTDFASNRRQEVKEYLDRRHNMNGKQRVFSAGTFSTMKLKAVLKDVCRVYKVPVSYINYITAIFEDDNMSWTDLFKLAATNKKVNKFVQDYPQVIEDIRGLMGQPRSASVHASAIIVTPNSKDGEDMECFDFTPIKKVDDILVSELDGYSIDETGLLKNDCLGIKELAKIQSVIDESNRVYNAGISFEGLVRSGLDDEKTYRILSKGYTQNVFQFSSAGMTKFLMDMQPDCINDLIAANALYRPATLESGSTQKYLDCKRGEVAPVYLWGTYKALKGTYGQLTYQEDLAQMAREIGGFSLGEGVNLVKYISKKKVEKIHAMRDKFMSGAHEKGCPKEDADLIWDMIEAGGSYIFNKSHATAYAITSYVGAWLKVNYPTAFYTIALQWADDKELPLIMSEMEECSSAKVVPPDINTSAEKFFTDYRTNEIFWSLGKIKMLGTKAVQYIIDERTKGGPFKSIENFIHRIFKYKLKKYEYWDDADNEQEAVRVPVNARHVKNLILAGCFDKVSNISAVVERYSILDKAATELGFKIPTSDYPDHLINQHYFWSMQQIEVCGIGRIDYKRIYDNSYCRHQFKGRASYSTVHNALLSGSEGKKVALCATVTEMEEISYKDKKTGERKHLCKLHLQQNNDLIKLVCWNDFYTENRAELRNIKGKIVIVSAIVKYNDYSGGNSLNTYKTSRLFTLNQSSENQINQEDGNIQK